MDLLVARVLLHCPDYREGPALRKLISSGGLELRLERLMLFDARCRYEPERTVQMMRAVRHQEGETREAWHHMVLSDTSPFTVTRRRVPGRSPKLYAELPPGVGVPKRPGGTSGPGRVRRW